LLCKPMLKKSHLRVEEHTMSLLGFIADGFS
jgi:hypothetical protein